MQFIHEKIKGSDKKSDSQRVEKLAAGETESLSFSSMKSAMNHNKEPCHGVMN